MVDKEPEYAVGDLPIESSSFVVEIWAAIWAAPFVAVAAAFVVYEIIAQPGRPHLAVHHLLTRLGAEQQGYGRYAYLVCKQAPRNGDRNAAAVRAVLDELPLRNDVSAQHRSRFAMTYVPVFALDGDPVMQYNIDIAFDIARPLKLDDAGPYIVVSSRPLEVGTAASSIAAHGSAERPSSIAILDMTGIRDDMMSEFVHYYSDLMAKGVEWEHNPPGYFFERLRNTLTIIGYSVEQSVGAIGIVARILTAVSEANTRSIEPNAVSSKDDSSLTQVGNPKEAAPKRKGSLDRDRRRSPRRGR